MLQKAWCFAFPAAIVVLALAGCSDLGPLVKPKPQAQLSALSLDFGTVALNQSATRSLVIQNIGTAALPVTPSITGAGYALPAGTTAFSVPAGGQWSLDVTFTPSAIGAYPSKLDLGTDAPQVALSGSGALQSVGAHITVAPTSVEFGLVSLGSAAPGAFQITSDGTTPAIVNVVSNTARVVVTSGGGPATLNPGAMLSVQLQFSPTTGGAFADSVATGPALPEVPMHATVTTVSFSRDVNPIFDATCGGCHVWWNMNSDAQSYASLVNVVAPDYPPQSPRQARRLCEFGAVRARSRRRRVRAVGSDPACRRADPRFPRRTRR